MFKRRSLWPDNAWSPKLPSNYKVLHAWGATFDDAEERLREQVEQHLRCGWKLHGSVAVSVRKHSTGGTVYHDSTDLAQAMTRDG
jgi:hypothetical protein